MPLALSGSWKEPIPEAMHDIIVMASVGLGITGIFGVFVPHGDVPIIVAAWVGMFLKLAEEVKLEFDKDLAFKLAGGLVAAVGGLVSGVKIAETFLAYTGIGTIPAMICNVGTNAAMTYVIGRALARVFLASDRSTTIEEMIRGVIRLIRPHHG